MGGSSIRFKRGKKADLPKSANSGTPLWCEDTNELYVGTGSSVSKIGVVSDTDDTTNSLNPIGVTSSDSSTLRKNTAIIMKGGTVTAQTFVGNLNGNATTSNSSTKATQDGNGNVITSTYLQKTGGTISGTLDLTKTTDLSGTANNSPALRIGSVSGEHLEFDGNEIHAKATGTTVGTLNLNVDGGDISFNNNTNKVLISNGTVTATNFSGLASKATADASGNVISSSYVPMGTTNVGANTDWDTLTNAGTYRIQSATMTSTYNAPPSEYAYGLLHVEKMKVPSSTEYRTIQIYYPHQPSISPIWVRMNNSNSGYTSWTAWKAMLTTTGTAAKATAVNNTRDNSSLKYWTGTKAQYDAIATKDDNTIYNITDDLMSVSAVEEIEAAKQKAIKDVGSAVEILYPIGSLYFTTNSACPLTNVLGTWQVVAKNIVVDISTKATAPVKGNGITMGFTDGTTNYGLQVTTNTENAWAYRTAAYGKSLPSTTGNSGNYPGTGADLGLTTDSTKSGIVADTSSLITKTNLTLNIFKRIS